MEPKVTSTVESTKHKVITRTVIILMAAVVIAEILWAGYTLTKPAETQPQASPSTAEVTPSAALTLFGPSMVSKGAEFRVDVNLNTSVEANSADVIITYDPTMLTIQPVTLNGKQAAVTTGEIFKDFPINTYDAKTGKITLSAITDTSSTNFSGQGKIGYVTFKAIKPGTTEVSIDYTEGSTTQSIVLSSKADKNILNQVKNLTVVIK